MALETAHDLSISDLLCVLNEKLGLECTRLRETPLPPAFSTAELESEIDGLEVRAQDVLRLISSLRNLSQPINRLPPEILSRIARHLMEDIHRDATSIIPLTHVCRYWRESIISIPENWTLISCHNEDMAAVSLERAKAAPLEICLHMPTATKYPSFPNIFLPSFGNTRTLAVYLLSTVEEFTDMFPGFPQSMPTLRSLTMDSVDPAWDQSIDLFEPFVPALKHLKLIDVRLYPSLLELNTLTEFTIHDSRFGLPLDTLLDFLEGNPSLERATLRINFVEPSLRISQRRITMKNQLQHLLVDCRDVMDARALISGIPIQRGAHLRVRLGDKGATLSDVLPESTAHLSTPPSPTHFKLEHRSYTSSILLGGPGGSFSFVKPSLPGQFLANSDFVGLPLANVREVRFTYSRANTRSVSDPPAFNPSSFPALETLAVDCDANVQRVLSALLSSPWSSPSLKTLAFLNCDLPEEFMEELLRFVYKRQNVPTSTWLYRVVIVNGLGTFPSAASIRRLRQYVKIVDVRMEDELSTDLT